MTKPQLALAGVVTALMMLAGGAVAIRTSAAPSTLAFVGGRSVAAAAPNASVAALASPALGPRAAPISSPTSIDAALIASMGYRFPPGASVYAAKVTKERGGLAYEDYEGGGGALARNFWPASSIKVLAAVGALEFVGQQGFTGAAMVSVGRDAPRTIRSIYDGAIRISDNADYDVLVEIAGVDWLNKQFLTPARGFPRTVIQRSYTVGGNLRSTPAITLSEGGRKITIPARNGKVDRDCPQGQCSDLFEMSESVRRVVLHNEIPAPERFQLASADVSGLTSALLGAEGWFEPAVARVLGNGARIYSKPGHVPGRDCLDVTLIEVRDGRRLLLAATVPERHGGCPALETLATNVLRLLTG